MKYTYDFAPIVLFAYKRPKELERTLCALKENFLASQSDLYIFVDGPKSDDDYAKVKVVQDLIEKLDGFKKIEYKFSSENRGLATSVIKGVSEIIEKYGRVIVLEDDLVTSKNFLDYMNQALHSYEGDLKIFSVSAYTFPFSKPTNYLFDGYTYPRTGSWGWATWNDRWMNVDWNISDYNQFITDKRRVGKFLFYGSDRLSMLKKWKTSKIDSWAIRFCYAQAKINAATIYPTVSKVINDGFTTESTNTYVYNRYQTYLDMSDQREFLFPPSKIDSEYYVKLFRNKFSIPVRIYNRFFTYILFISRWYTNK